MATVSAPEQRAIQAPVWLWPSLRKAAAILRISPAALSRQVLPTEVCGQEHKLSPTTVLQLADRYRRRPTEEVGALLIEVARPLVRSREELIVVEDEVSQYFTDTGVPTPDQDDWWLREAKRRLPRDVYQHIVALTRTEPLGAIRGVRPSQTTLPS